MRWLLLGLVVVPLLGVAVYAVAAHGPFGLRAEYRRAVAERLEGGAPAALVTDADLASLPDPVQRYLRRSGAVRQPHVRHFSVETRGRIRGSADEPWMDFTATQTNFVAEPSRFFLMDARRGGLPVDVFHAFRNGEASMRVRLLSLLQLVNASGPEMTRAETVTLFNDLCLFAPGALVDAPIRWDPIDERTARGQYTVGENTVTADLHFDADGDLVDFRSEDRLYARPDGEGFARLPWSTPVRDYREYGDTRVASHGEGVWEAADGAFTYIELEVTDVLLNGRMP